jgi:succinylglutamate desuccinylase
MDASPDLRDTNTLGRPTPAAREIGRICGASPGPTLIVVGGIHGNEPAGTTAARRVLSRLGRDDAGLRGEFVAFAGNLAALRLRKRYQSKDLNRVWTEARVRELRAEGSGSHDAEDIEQRELLDCLEAAIDRARGDVYFVDLHTSSAAGIPFAFCGDTLRQRKFARAFPLPIILGLEEQIDGTLSEYLTYRGCITLAVEGGQHDDPASVDHLEAALWIALVEAGLVARERVEGERARALALLDARRGRLPRVMEVVERHAIRPEDEFVMAPGFTNLDRARRGQLLARDRRGEIRAPNDGFVILPLYQGQGNDGFFWGREMSEARLRATEVVRRAGLDRVLPWLPGVRRDPGHRDRLHVDPRVARIYPLDVFYMFGYRRIRRHGAALVVQRRPH